MNEIVETITDPVFNLRTTESKMKLVEVMLTQPQVRNSIVHRFGPGIYIREATYPANSLIVGQYHLSEHMNVLLKGKIEVIDGNGNVNVFTAPYMFVAPPGSKIGRTLEEVIWQNIYATTETNVEVLEQTLFKAPQIFHDHLAKQLEERTTYHEIDREDYREMLMETGWDAAVVEQLSKYRGDCISFPYGSYSIIEGNSPIQGKGMFATAHIKPGEIIAPMRLNECRTPAGYLINHSKYPNAQAVLNPNGDMYLVAIRDIQGMDGGFNGDEITTDYRHTMKLNNLLDWNTKCLQE